MITNDGEQLIKFFESLQLKSYKCPAGVWTIGWGHTATARPGMEINRETAQKYFNADIEACEHKVRVCLGISVLKTVRDYEYDVLVSLAFNMTSKSLKKLCEYYKTSKELFKQKLILYSKDINGQELRGLARRRRAELLRFQGWDWSDILKLDKKDFKNG